jgi:hypothetical protein
MIKNFFAFIKNWMLLSIVPIIIVLFLITILYSIVGVGTRIDTIKKMVTPQVMAERNWKILRYEGFQYGSWMTHGGKCWYHVANIDNPNIQYRVQVSLWGDELQWWYDKPETLNRVSVNLNNQ